MLCGGITESGVAIALTLAKERFGSTLTINGTADSKRLVVDAVAKNGLDVHFSDKARNVSLAARRTELEIEKGGQSIVPANDRPQHVDNTNRASRDLADRLDLTKPIEELHGQGQAAEQISRVIAPKLETHVPEPERAAFVGDVAKSLGIPIATSQRATRRSRNGKPSALVMLRRPLSEPRGQRLLLHPTRRRTIRRALASLSGPKSSGVKPCPCLKPMCAVRTES